MSDSGVDGGETPEEMPVEIVGDSVVDDSLVESVIAGLEGANAELDRVTAERDEYLRLAQSKQAELENFRKRMMKQQADEVARASGRLIEAMLPVLDAFDYGVAHGSDDLVPMRDQLLTALQREGLERLDPGGEAFDPNEHEAVAHEPGDGDGDDSIVAEVLRAGYRWQGQLLRPVMVKVKG